MVYQGVEGGPAWIPHRKQLVSNDSEDNLMTGLLSGTGRTKSAAEYVIMVQWWGLTVGVKGIRVVLDTKCRRSKVWQVLNCRSNAVQIPER